MSNNNGKMGGILELVRNVVAVQSGSQLADHDLLQRYIASQEESAFAVLVKRYGSMVWGLCWRILRHQQDAEDAFQAAFLILARKARTIRKSESLAGWLHSVAFRAANRLRAAQARRLAREVPLFDVPQAGGSRDLSYRETQRVLTEELNRLADKYRAPLLLCCVEGRTRDEAAQQLGWSLGVLRGRLDRGRKLLCGRLTRRGFSLSVALLTLSVAGTSQAAVLPALLSATVQTVTGAAQSPAAAGAVSAQVTALVQGVIQSMFLAKVKCLALGLLTLTFLGMGASFVTYHLQAQERPQPGVQKKHDTKQPSTEEMSPAQLKREVERLRLELQQTRLLLKLANEEILELRAARQEAAAGIKEKQAAAIAKLTALEEETHFREMAVKALASLKQGDNRDGILARVSPDGKLIAAAHSKFISILDTVTGKELRRCLGHSDTVSSLAFNPSGKMLASGSQDKSVVLWDVPSGKIVAKFSQQEAVLGVAFSPDGSRLLVRGKTGTREIDATTGELLGGKEKANR